MDLTATLESVLSADARLDPAAFARGGAAPRAAFAPSSAAEVAELLRACTADALRVRIHGGGVHAGAGPAADVALSLARFDHVVNYEPGDLTCTLGAGLTLERAAQPIAAQGQELPLESARAAQATIGGVCAANVSGPRRAWLGSPRDRVLGMRYVTGDGVVARSGGRVVKNVAGYGIHRLLCGSRGSLAVILEVSFKLLPAPERRLALCFALGVEPALAERLRALRSSRVEPAVLTVLDATSASRLELPASPHLVLGLEADAPWAAEQERIAIGLLGSPAQREEQDAAARLWRRLADLEDESAASIALMPSRIAEGIARAREAGASEAWAHVESGKLCVRFAATAGLESLRVALGLGGGADEVAGAMRERLRAAFDPRPTLAG